MTRHGIEVSAIMSQYPPQDPNYPYPGGPYQQPGPYGAPPDPYGQPQQPQTPYPPQTGGGYGMPSSPGQYGQQPGYPSYPQAPQYPGYGTPGQPSQYGAQTPQSQYGYPMGQPPAPGFPGGPAAPSSNRGTITAVAIAGVVLVLVIVGVFVVRALNGVSYAGQWYGKSHIAASTLTADLEVFLNINQDSSGNITGSGKLCANANGTPDASVSFTVTGSVKDSSAALVWDTGSGTDSKLHVTATLSSGQMSVNANDQSGSLTGTLQKGTVSDFTTACGQLTPVTG